MTRRIGDGQVLTGSRIGLGLAGRALVSIENNRLEVLRVMTSSRVSTARDQRFGYLCDSRFTL